MDHDHTQLAGEHVLVVEDEVLVSLELESILEEAGAAVELCRSTPAALDRLKTTPITSAILDVRLGSETVTPVAHRLAECGIPFMFYTGQSRSDPVLAEWPEHRIVTKPAASASIVRALAETAAR